MRPGGHKKGHSQIGESAHAHPLPLGGVIAIRRTFPKFSGAAWDAPSAVRAKRSRPRREYEAVAP